MGVQSWFTLRVLPRNLRQAASRGVGGCDDATSSGCEANVLFAICAHRRQRSSCKDCKRRQAELAAADAQP